MLRVLPECSFPNNILPKFILPPKNSGRGQTECIESIGYSYLIPSLEMGPVPTRAYFWPAVNKRLTCLWPEYFWTWPKENFLTRRGKKLKNLTILGKFSKPKPQMADLTQPGSKNFDPLKYQIFKFLAIRAIKNLIGLGQKVPKSKPDRPLSYYGPKVWSCRVRAHL